MKKISNIVLAIAAIFTVASCTPKVDRTSEMLEKIELGEVPDEVDIFKFQPTQSEVAWKGQNILGDSHNGTISVKKGEFYVYNGQLLGGHVDIDMTSIVVLDIEDPGMNGRLKGHLESDDFFSVATHPIAIIEFAEFQKIEGAASGEPNYRVLGNLTIKGITHGIAFDAVIDMAENKISAKSDLVFDRSKYEVRFGSGKFFDNLGDNLILDDINLNVEVVAQL